MSREQTKIFLDLEDEDDYSVPPKQQSTFPNNSKQTPQINHPSTKFTNANNTSNKQQRIHKQSQLHTKELAQKQTKVNQNEQNIFRIHDHDNSKKNIFHNSFQAQQDQTIIQPNKNKSNPSNNFFNCQDSFYQHQKHYFNINCVDKNKDQTNNSFQFIKNPSITYNQTNQKKRNRKIRIIKDQSFTNYQDNNSSYQKNLQSNQKQTNIYNIPRQANMSQYSNHCSVFKQNQRQVHPYQQFTLKQSIFQREIWIEQINNSRLFWKNSKSSPLQIKIMLNQLSLQASSNTYKLQNYHDFGAVSNPIPLSSRFSCYPQNSQIRKWAKQFCMYRKIKGDGNCFYRAFVFSFLQMALTNPSSIYFLKFLLIVSNPSKVNFKTDYRSSKTKDLTPQKMRSFILQRLLFLYSYRVTLTENKDANWQHKMIKILQQVFNQSGFCFDILIIIAIKNFAIFQIDQDSNLKNYEQIDIVKQQIFKYGQECELNQFTIKVLSNGLKVCISLYQQLKNNFRFQTYGDKKRQKIILYFRPGHYDIVYPYKQVYDKINKQK